ncbi:MAG: AAA family ATPase [Hormoscilla sp. GUM202]|nr:AAA family ATPase [Hormoscilla sp. GUM202]
MNDLRRSFFRACNPSKTIDMADAAERKYYIDFASVRGAETVRELGETISLTNPDPSCQLFTGHIGCGKSTELLRLKQELEQDGFHVVYFESDRELDIGDVDISDILLAIAHQIGESLSAAKVSLPGQYFTNLLKECADFLQAPVELGVEVDIPIGLGKLKAQTKDSPKLRSQLRQYLEPQTEGLLRAINEELLLPAAPCKSWAWPGVR